MRGPGLLLYVRVEGVNGTCMQVPMLMMCDLKSKFVKEGTIVLRAQQTLV